MSNSSRSVHGAMSPSGVQPNRDRKNNERSIRSTFEKHTTLTNRELEILELSSNGLTAPEIAKELYLAMDTVKGYRKRIILKLGAKNITHAVSIGLKCDLI